MHTILITRCVLLEDLAVLLTSTLKIFYSLRNFLYKAIGIINFIDDAMI